MISFFYKLYTYILFLIKDFLNTKVIYIHDKNSNKLIKPYFQNKITKIFYPIEKYNFIETDVNKRINFIDHKNGNYIYPIVLELDVMSNEKKYSIKNKYSDNFPIEILNLLLNINSISVKLFDSDYNLITKNYDISNIKNKRLKDLYQ
jgi:hypothetical protein